MRRRAVNKRISLGGSETLEIPGAALGNRAYTLGEIFACLQFQLLPELERGALPDCLDEPRPERRADRDDRQWSTLSNLALVLCDEGKLSDAESAIRAALAARKKVFGDSHPSVTASQRDLTNILALERKSTAARE